MDSQMSRASLLQTARYPSVLGENISNSFLKALVAYEWSTNMTVLSEMDKSLT